VKRLLLLITAFHIGFLSFAQNENRKISSYQVPDWWKNAKFGIFIHWGVYSVPSFADHDYAEWYWAHKVDGEAKKFHENVYGDDFDYYDFAPMFKAEFFNANDWAELFSKAGAKYIVLTAKHMEGFTLWKSDIANQLHERKWNSVETGPKRDIVAELTESVTQHNMRMGLYFMLYEHMNPVYQNNPKEFIEKYSIPQFKDLYRTYKPSIVWPDGSWKHTASEYHSEELINWLLDSLPNPDNLVINNRWGIDLSDIGHATTEYTYMLEPESLTDAWEECRGIGESFGFNRNETLAEYSSSQELILMLVDVVSNGGNLLLNVGPTADGRIPIFMQERLLDIGNWLEINGEAIYGTTKYKVTTQWSEGQRRDIHPNDLAEPIVDGVAERKYILDNFNILKLTVNPEEGQAVKEIMFTRKVNTIYGIMPKFPRETLIIKHVKPTEKTEVILLGTEISLKWNYEDGIMYVDVPTNVVFDLPFQYAYTFKLTNMD
jgi:alpha-L-fucosidase